MQKIINDPKDVVDEMLKGYMKVHSDIVSETSNPRVLKYSHAPVPNKVGIVTGGGSGHKPAFIGYIGRNMVDAVAVGEIFSSPPAQMFYDAFKAVNSGKGIVCLFGNFAGDVMNVNMAIEMAEDEGIEVRTVIANDDVPSAPKTRRENRRGATGEVLMWKIGGAKASMGGNLKDVISVVQKAIDNTRSMSLGLIPCTIPEVGHPNFTIEKGNMEIGIGHHGEPGLETTALETADKIAKRMTDILLPDLPFRRNDKVVVMLSGLGATPLIELYILYNEIQCILRDNSIEVHTSYVGNYFTSLDMAGITLAIMKIDQELKECIDYEAYCMGLKQLKR